MVVVAATFFGLLDRVCPLEPLVEIFPVKQCFTDDECFPRICCPEGIENRVSYCRTPTPNFEQFPGNADFFQRNALLQNKQQKRTICFQFQH